MKVFVTALFLCSPLMLGGCILAAAGAGAGAGVAISDSEHHDGHETSPDESASPPAEPAPETPEQP